MILVSIVIILLLHLRNKSQLLRLHDTIDMVENLKKSLGQIKVEKRDLERAFYTEDTNSENVEHLENEKIHDLRNKLRDELIDLIKKQSGKYEVSPIILNSSTYENLTDKIITDKAFSENNPIWGELESLVLTISPNFINRFRLLTGGKFKKPELHIALLIKCGIPPKNMAKLMGKTKSAISYWRESLTIKVFGSKMSNQELDEIIRTL